MPVRRPRCILRYLTLFGISIYFAFFSVAFLAGAFFGAGAFAALGAVALATGLAGVLAGVLAAGLAGLVAVAASAFGLAAGAVARARFGAASGAATSATAGAVTTSAGAVSTTATGCGAAEVDVGTQGVQRHAAFAVPLTTRHLGTAESTAAVDTDALRAGAHRAQDRLLHRPLVADAALDLGGDVLGHQLCVELGLLDLLDGDSHAIPKSLFQVLTQLVDRRAALADDDAGFGGVDGDGELGVGRALGLDLGDAGIAQARKDRATHLEILVKHLRVVLGVCEPVRLPRAEHAEPERVRMDFMTQLFLFLWAVFDDRGDVAGAVEELVRHAAADRPAPPICRAFVDEQLLDHQVFAIEVEVVLGVGSRGLDRLGDIARGVLGRELQVRQGFRHLHALDGVGHEPRFARRTAHVPLHC